MYICKCILHEYSGQSRAKNFSQKLRAPGTTYNTVSVLSNNHQKLLIVKHFAKVHNILPMVQLFFSEKNVEFEPIKFCCN